MARSRTKTAPSYTTPTRRATGRTGGLGVARVRVDQDRPVRGPDDLCQDALDPHPAYPAQAAAADRDEGGSVHLPGLAQDGARYAAYPLGARVADELHPGPAPQPLH